jgi:hypothetical protein
MTHSCLFESGSGCGSGMTSSLASPFRGGGCTIEGPLEVVSLRSFTARGRATSNDHALPLHLPPHLRWGHVLRFSPYLCLAPYWGQFPGPGSGSQICAFDLLRAPLCPADRCTYAYRHPELLAGQGQQVQLPGLPYELYGALRSGSGGRKALA